MSLQVEHAAETQTKDLFLTKREFALFHMTTTCHIYTVCICEMQRQIAILLTISPGHSYIYWCDIGFKKNKTYLCPMQTHASHHKEI